MTIDQIIYLKANTDMLISNIEYDKSEMKSLNYQLNSLLEKEENNRLSLIDKMVIKLINSSYKKKNKFRRKKYTNIRTAIVGDNIDSLAKWIDDDTDLNTLRQNTADFRYELKSLLLLPSSNKVGNPLRYTYQNIQVQLDELESIAYEINDYLELKYNAQIEEISTQD